LEFVKLQKNKIAFGTSFGRSEYNKTPEEIQKNKYLLNRFNHIALREKSTELENLFNLKKAEEIIDPTLMIDAQYWGKLSDGVSLAEAQEPYLLAYMLDLTENKINVLKYISSTLSLKIILIPDLDKRHRRVKHDLPLYKDEYTPEEFLYLYKNASFVVTDSYHGTCFATKFNKPFISIINRARGGLRYKLFDAIKVSSRLVDNPDDIYNNAQLFQPFDFSETNKIIQKKTDFAVTWLKDALSHNNSEEKFSENELYASSQVIELSRQLDELSTRVTHISKLAESNMKKNDHPHIDKQTTLKITSYFGGIVKKVNNERSKKLYLLGIPIYNKEHL
jgi:hypothetical protein